MNRSHKKYKIRIEKCGDSSHNLTKEQVLELNWQCLTASTLTYNYDYIVTYIENTEFVLYFSEHEIFDHLLDFTEFELIESEFKFLKMRTS